MNHQKKRIELLAPAGGMNQYIAAVENGADAIYLGGKSYNARMGAGNFTDRELEQAIDYGHQRGVKSYITMNTLLRDEELPQALGFAKYMYQAGADGLIVQDLGLGELIRQSFPDMPLHLSTQGSVYDRRGVEAAARLGYSRVVLARELSLQEIEAACGKKHGTGSDGADPEIEVFVHGALCICYSGQCQLSRFIGGRSGNRGGCAQPCRLPYKYLDQEGRQRKEAVYPLSPKDLCLVEELGALADAGVASLKIEGRMKSPEYVAVVTSIYRKYLDQYLEHGSYTVSEEDFLALNQIFNRGGFTQAYFYQDPGRDLMCSGLPKHQGVPVGKVVRQIEGGGHARQQGGHLIDVRMDRGVKPIEIGDGVEVHSRQITGNVVTYLKPMKDGMLRIGDIKGKVEPGDPIYRITDRTLMECARKTYENLTLEEGRFVRKTPVSVRFLGGVGKSAVLEVLEPLSFAVTEESAVGQRPEKRATAPEEIEKQLRKTGGTPFEMETVDVELSEPAMIPLSGINALRRRALEELALRLKMAYKRTLPAGEGNLPEGAAGDFGSDVANALAGGGREGDGGGDSTGEIQYYFHDYRDLRHMAFPAEKAGAEVTALIHVRDFVTHQQEIQQLEEREHVLVCPYIPAINKGGDRWIEDRLEEIAELVRAPGPEGRARRIHVGNLGWIRPFAERGVLVFGEPGLNICNQMARRAYGQLGVYDSVDSLEVLDGDGGAAGWLPLMVTEHEMEPGVLVDRKGLRLRVVTTPDNHKTYILGKRDEKTTPGAEILCRKTKKRIRIYE